MNWFKPKTTEPQQRTVVRVIHSTSMRMDQWRTSPELVVYAQKLFESPQFQTLLDVLRNESPSSYGLPIGATHDDQIAHSYKATGYNLCLNNMETLSNLHKQQDILEATFEAEPGRVIKQVT